MVEHVLQLLYLFIGDDSGGVLTGIGEDLVDVSIGADAPFGHFIGMDEDDHGDDNALDFLLAVAPLMDFPLTGDVRFYLELAQSAGYGLLATDLDQGCNPTFRVRFAVVSPMDCRSGNVEVSAV